MYRMFAAVLLILAHVPLAAGQPVVLKPIFNPDTNSYFELVRTVGGYSYMVNSSHMKWSDA